MNEWMKVLISLSISGSMIGLLIVLLQTILKERFSKTWQYYIWIIVIARLLIPFSTDQNLTDMLYREFDARIQLGEQQQTGASEELYYESAGSFVVGNERYEINDLNKINEANKINQLQILLNKMRSELSYLWFLIATLLFVRKVTNYYGYIRYMKAGCKEIYDDLTISIYMDVCRDLRIKNPIPIYVNALSASASLVGVRKRFIVLPSIELTEDELYFIFKHELIHHKRNDIFYKWVVQFTACIHWFNPFVYLMIKEHDKLCELSCDESVIRGLSSFDIRVYGDTLLSTIQINGTFAGNTTSLTLNEDAKLLKERLVSIMNFKEKTRSVVAITLLVTGGFIFGAVFAGSYSTKQILADTTTQAQTMKIDATEWVERSEVIAEVSVEYSMEDKIFSLDELRLEDDWSRWTEIDIVEDIEQLKENFRTNIQEELKEELKIYFR